MRRLIPLAISAGLVGWLIWRIAPEKLGRAAQSLDWPLLAWATLALVLALFGWDAVCLRWLFTRADRPLSYPESLRARAGSYLWSAFNYEAGQAVLAWNVARTQKIPVLSALGGCLILALHDLVVLLSLGLAGTLANTDRRAALLRPVCGVALMVLATLLGGWKLLPGRWHERIQQTRLGSWLRFWSWRDSLLLVLLRLGYYGIMLLYAVVALNVCGVGLDGRKVAGVVPLVLLADALPSVSGFGTRDTALLGLLELSGEQQAVLLNFSLFWSAGLMTGRLGIGLASWWLTHPAEPGV